VRLKKRQFLAVGCIVSILLLYRSVDTQKFIQADEPGMVAIPQLDLSAIPVKNQVFVEPVLNATAAYVVDESSGAELFSKNAATLYAPASTTKLMTALVARRLYKPGSIVTVNLKRPIGGTVLGLRTGEQYSLDSLLEAALIASANDAAEVLAEQHPEGIDAFVGEMNAVATELHLENTHFSNPSGFDAEDHYSTAHDLLLLSREVLKDPVLRRIVGTKNSEIKDVTGTRRITLKSTNQLLGVDSRVQGIKTGTTEEAGEVLVTLTNDGSRKLILVVLGSRSRYTDTLALLNWVGSSYTWHSPEELLQQAEAAK
jgi:serine-type D-Ala-D-Ala carboxypeptidase (penicillin-binding protein 5/6)